MIPIGLYSFCLQHKIIWIAIAGIENRTYTNLSEKNELIFRRKQYNIAVRNIELYKVTRNNLSEDVN